MRLGSRTQVTFSAISNNAFSVTFIANLNNLFNYQVNDIPNIFNERKLSLLRTLRDKLLLRVATDFPDVTDKTPVYHKKKADNVSDIIKLGLALARPNMPNELNTIFIPLESESVEDTELQNDQLKDPDTLIAVVKQIRLDLNTAKSEIKTMFFFVQL